MRKRKREIQTQPWKIHMHRVPQYFITQNCPDIRVPGKSGSTNVARARSNPTVCPGSSDPPEKNIL